MVIKKQKLFLLLVKVKWIYFGLLIKTQKL